MQTKAIIFDLEGVIADTNHIWDEADRAFLSQRGLNWSDMSWVEAKASLNGMSLRDGASYVKDYFNLPDAVDELIDERFQIVQQLFQKTITFVPGFQELWRLLPDSKYRMAVATALHPELLTIVQERLALPTYFNTHIYSVSEVGWKSKPDPAVFLFAAEKLGVVPSQCVVIEDSPKGIMGARAAGMKSIGFSGTFEKQHLSAADVVIDDLLDVATYIGKEI
ncbi:MAG: HAD family phosphatase [Patescibacteria group bacterium]